jgi:HAD superfamily hydrolase (TIGR01549 family)
MSYDGLLLDFDGVVVDILEDEKRLPAVREKIVEKSTADDIELDAEIVAALAESIKPERLQSVSEEIDLPAEQLWQYRDDAFLELFETAARNDGKNLYPDVTALDELAVPLGIASNNQTRIVEVLVAEYELAGHFETIHAREPTPESLGNKKPEPVFLERAMADLAVENPLYVGDKETDIIAGQRGGIDTALIRREHNADRTIETEPTYEVTSLDEVVALFEQPG